MEHTPDFFMKPLPELHSWDGGKTWNSGGFHQDTLKELYHFLKKHLPPGASIVETGAGNSTLLFLMVMPNKVISIAPDEELFNRIGKAAKENSISTSSLISIPKGSEWALPELVLNDKSTQFDFGLIDGCHNWPHVFLDFFYINYVIKKNGYIMIDDIHLHSVRELRYLLDEDPNFNLVLDLGKSLVYQKLTAEKVMPEWNQQPYIIRRTTDSTQENAKPGLLSRITSFIKSSLK